MEVKRERREMRWWTDATEVARNSIKRQLLGTKYIAFLFPQLVVLYCYFIFIYNKKNKIPNCNIKIS